ncbi:MAG: hypothetical protein M3O34_10240 [Chloroflexota bacterium]|nr:hypothetical protein [Chloroflexota bacterium]
MSQAGADDQTLHPVGMPHGAAATFLAGLIVTAPVAPTVAGMITVAVYTRELVPVPGALELLAHPLLAAPLILAVAWLALAVPCLVLDLTNPERVNPTSYSALSGRANELMTWCGARAGPRQPDCRNARPADNACSESIHRVICEQAADIAHHLQTREIGWTLAVRYLTLWRQLHWAEALLAYVEPDDRLLMRAAQARARLADSKMNGAVVMDGELRRAMAALSAPPDGSAASVGQAGEHAKAGELPMSRSEARATISRIQRAIDDFRDDRYAGLLGARNQLLWTSGATAVGLYALLWLAIAAGVAPTTIMAATAFYLVGVIVGLFNLLYAQAGADSMIDDYGLSAARLIVTPQLAGMAAVMGVVIATMVTATQVPEVSLAESFDLLKRPVNILTAAVFALSPGLILDRLRQRVDDYKEDLNRSRDSTGHVP